MCVGGSLASHSTGIAESGPGWGGGATPATKALLCSCPPSPRPAAPGRSERTCALPSPGTPWSATSPTGPLRGGTLFFSSILFLTSPPPPPPRPLAPAEAEPVCLYVCVCVRDEVIANPSHSFQAGCRGSLSQVEPVRAAGTGGDKGGSPGCVRSPAAWTSAGAAGSAGLGSARTPPPPPPRLVLPGPAAAGLGRGRGVLPLPRGARAGLSERVSPVPLNAALLGDCFPFPLVCLLLAS